METKDTCFYEESFIDRLFLVLEILMTTQAKNAKKNPKKSTVNRVKNSSHRFFFLYLVFQAEILVWTNFIMLKN